MKKFLLLTLFVSFGLIPLKTIAQPPDPGGGTNPPCFPPPCVPIDGGLSFLLIAGAAYGGKKFYDLNKNEEDL